VANVERPRPESWLSLLWLVGGGHFVVCCSSVRRPSLQLLSSSTGQLIAAPIRVAADDGSRLGAAWRGKAPLT